MVTNVCSKEEIKIFYRGGSDVTAVTVLALLADLVSLPSITYDSRSTNRSDHSAHFRE